MTTVRKWGVDLADGWWFESREASVEILEMVTLRTSPTDAAIDAAGIHPEFNPTVREVLVTQEAGGIEVDKQWRCASNQRLDCVVSFTEAYASRSSGYLGFTQKPCGIDDALVFVTSALAWENAVRYMEMRGGDDRGGYCEVWSIRRTEPREVRRAGRTLDEILASVPVEVPSDE